MPGGSYRMTFIRLDKSSDQQCRPAKAEFQMNQPAWFNRIDPHYFTAQSFAWIYILHIPALSLGSTWHQTSTWLDGWFENKSLPSNRSMALPIFRRRVASVLAKSPRVWRARWWIVQLQRLALFLIGLIKEFRSNPDELTAKPFWRNAEWLGGASHGFHPFCLDMKRNNLTSISRTNLIHWKALPWSAPGGIRAVPQ